MKNLLSDGTLKIVNIVLPVIGIGLMLFYQICDTSCSYLRGTFLGLDLKIIGILFMAVLLLLNLPIVRRFFLWLGWFRTALLSGALGGEVLLVRFQIVNNTFCPFCLMFGLCILLLFGANAAKMNKYVALCAFILGIGAFFFFFKGSILPLYS